MCKMVLVAMCTNVAQPFFPFISMFRACFVCTNAAQTLYNVSCVLCIHLIHTAHLLQSDENKLNDANTQLSKTTTDSAEKVDLLRCNGNELLLQCKQCKKYQRKLFLRAKKTGDTTRYTVMQLVRNFISHSCKLDKITKKKPTERKEDSNGKGLCSEDHFTLLKEVLVEGERHKRYSFHCKQCQIRITNIEKPQYHTPALLSNLRTHTMSCVEKKGAKTSSNKDGKTSITKLADSAVMLSWIKQGSSSSGSGSGSGSSSSSSISSSSSSSSSIIIIIICYHSCLLLFHHNKDLSVVTSNIIDCKYMCIDSINL